MIAEHGVESGRIKWQHQADCLVSLLLLDNLSQGGCIISDISCELPVIVLALGNERRFAWMYLAVKKMENKYFRETVPTVNLLFF